MLRSHPPSPEEVRRGNESGRQREGLRQLEGQAPASPAMPAEAATRTPAQRWELGEAQRSQMADIKSELTTKVNEVKESNDLKINK